MKRMATYKTKAGLDESDQLFLGGTLELQVVDGEKIGEDGNGENIFGTGTFDSCVEIVCGSQLLTKSTVKNGMLDYRVGRRKWDGFDSSLKPVVITPNLPSVVTIKIFECNRERKSDMLGEARLNLVDVIPGRVNSEALPIMRRDEVFLSGSAGEVGKVHVKAVFTPFEPNIVRANDSVAVPVNISNNLGKFSIGVGYNTVLTDNVGISLAMFNAEGNFVDAVSVHKRTSTAGLTACHENVVPHVGYKRDRHEITFELPCAGTSRRGSRSADSASDSGSVKAVFLVLSNYTEFGSLEHLKAVYVRLMEGRCGRELHRVHGLEVDKPASSAVVLRMVRDDSDPSVWHTRAYDNLWAYDAREHGFLVPRLKSLLQDVIPEVAWSNSDRMATLDVEESMCLHDYCAEPTSLPAELSLGLSWEPLRGGLPPLDLGCVLLSAKFELEDEVHLQQSRTSCGSVKHAAGAGNEEGEGGGGGGGGGIEQAIHFSLGTVPESVTYLCFYVTCPGAQSKLTGAQACAAKLTDSGTKRRLAVFSVQDRRQFDSSSAMLMCFCFRLESKWYFQVAGSGSGAAAVESAALAGHAKKYLMDKRATQRRMQINSNYAKFLKRYESGSKHVPPR